MEIACGRVTDPTSLSAAAITNELLTGDKVVIQFSQASAYSPALLQELNEICRRSSKNLEIRFYGHYGSNFDALVLNHLPDVKNLSLDCLNAISNQNAISSLEHLFAFSFGVYDFEDPQFLTTLELRRLTSLSLGENRKRNLDLRALSTCFALERLYVEGHSAGIEATASLTNLVDVTLRSFPKSQNIAFLSEVSNLRELSLVLGGRENIAEFSSETLRTLQILRVRGLDSIDNLKRFPNLRNLRVEDQIKLENLDLSGAQLERLWLYNCKSLERIIDLNHQTHLREFFASQVALDLESLRDFKWPETTKKIGLFSGRRMWNEATEKILKDRGYSQNFHSWR